MNISYNWLKNYINPDVDAFELGNILTSIGLEVESVAEVQMVKGGLEGLVIGKVLTCVAHENSDHLHVTTVDVGQAEPLQIVCGAPNVAANQKVVVAPIGTKLYAGDEVFSIKRSKIRGVESFGMICAEDEIGIGKSHDGIIVLPDDAVIGMPAKEYYKIENDHLIEVDITPNRVDAASHYGVARDLSAYYSIRKPQIKLRKPSVDAFASKNKDLALKVQVDDTALCPRYSGLLISNIRVGESPDWLKNYLLVVGLRPINNVVDVTNFVLHELGQPLHAFDADKITSGEVRIRTLSEGTKFTTLDGVERSLSAEDLMICNGDVPMCIAGVFGGLDSGVSETTRNVFLESAYFNPVSVRKTARRHALNTDSSFRFERGCDPANTVYALKRAALLIQEFTGGSIASDVIDIYPQAVEAFELNLSFAKIRALTGVEIPRQEVETLLRALEIEICAEEDGIYRLKVPSYRVDVQRDVDVIEELLRLYGYNRVEPGEAVRATLSYSEKPDNYKLQQLISEQLTGQGFNEIMNNSFTKDAYYTYLTSYKPENCVRLLNPLSSDLNVMRQTLLFGGLDSIARNIKYRNTDLWMYEFGNCYSYNPKLSDTGKALKAYSEDFRLGIWMTGDRRAQSWTTPEEKLTVYDLKAYVEAILLRLGIDLRSLSMTESEDDIFSSALSLSGASGETLAVYGILRPAVCRSADVEVEVFFAELNWTALLNTIRNHKVETCDLPKYPEVKRDLALLIDKRVRFSEIERLAFRTERKLLRKVSLFDVYEGKSLQEGKKSYAVNFVLRDDDKTLTDDQIDSVMKKLQRSFEEELGAQLR